MRVADSDSTLRYPTAPSPVKTDTPDGLAMRWLCPVASPRARTADGRRSASLGIESTATRITSPCRYITHPFRCWWIIQKRWRNGENFHEIGLSLYYNPIAHSRNDGSEHVMGKKTGRSK